MTPLEIVAWVGGALGLAGLAWAFFKSDRLPVRLWSLGAFGVFYLTVLALGWRDATWFNATITGVAIIALVSRMKAPLTPSRPASDEPAEARSGRDVNEGIEHHGD